MALNPWVGSYVALFDPFRKQAGRPARTQQANARHRGKILPIALVCPESFC
jgi:hypothetical protein